MILYRVSNHADLTGKGGKLADGRWHTHQQGRRIVYLSDHPALCLLEILVHTEREEEMPNTYQLLSLEVPDHLVDSLEPKQLPNHWQADISITQHIGNQWLTDSTSACMLVPSVIIPIAKNCLLNPLFPDANRLKPKIVGRFPFDARLLSRRFS